MRSFFKIFFATLLALVIFSLLGFFIMIGIVSSASTPGKEDVGDKAVLLIDLSKQFKEQEQENPLGALVGEGEDIPGLHQLVSLIAHAKTDSAIKGIYIKCSDNANGFASSQEIRNAILDFKKSKKFVIAYGEVISQNAYYVANAADKVYCNPQGSLEWSGMASTMIYFKGALEKLEIQPQIFYAGKFKSATEPFRESKMSDANRLQTSVYLNDLYSQLLLTTTQRTGLDTAALHQLANSGAIQTGKDAVRFKLIDAVKYDDEIHAEMAGKLNIKATDKINFASPAKYMKSVSLYESDGGKIALIVAEGEIVDGKSKAGTIGSEDFSALVRKARLEKSIKAIVLRVNSPGGSALASEVILRELQLAKKAKPVIVSFGDVAASGGYYIATGADSIFAQPNSITGSIGVFAMIPNFQMFFQNKLGVTFDRVTTGPFADFSVTRPLNEVERRFIQNSIDTIYHDFKSRVANGRKMSMVMVDSIAQGRVWTGERALKLGLVDRLGSTQDAINSAAKMAKLKEYKIKEYPEKKGFLENLMSSYSTGVKAKTIKEEIGVEQYETYQRLKNLKALFSVPQARLPFDLEIR